MIADCFLDTNVIVYAAAGHDASPEKHRIAQGLMGGQFAVSGQVLAEFYTVILRKSAGPKAVVKASALDWLRLLSRKPCQPIDAPLVMAAVELSDRHKISYWDAAIIAAAERLGARTVYSEDLCHGRTYGSVAVVNPFLKPQTAPA